MDVVERRDLLDHRDVADDAGVRVVGVGLEAGVGQDLGLVGPGQTGLAQVQVGRAVQQAGVQLVGVGGDGQLDDVRQGLAERVGGGVPVLVADQLVALARLGCPELVRAGGDRLLTVLGAGVQLLRDGRGRAHGQQVREVRVGLRQAEHDGVVVRGGDRPEALPVRVGVGVGALVVLALVQLVGQVVRAAGDDVLREAALDAVLDVLRGDDRAVLELEPRPEPEGVGPAVGGDLRLGGREVGDELRTVPARLGVVGHQGAGVEALEVPREGVVGAGRVERVEVVARPEIEGAALLVGRVHHLAHGSVERGCGPGTGR